MKNTRMKGAKMFIEVEKLKKMFVTFSSALLLLVLVLSSGCVNDGREAKVDPNNGLIINEFSVSPDFVEKGDEIEVYLEVENVGWTTASKVSANLYGWSWGGAGTKNLGILRPPDISNDPPTPGDFDAKTWILTAPELPEGTKTTYTLTGRVTYNYKSTGVAQILAYNEDEYNRRREKGEELIGDVVVDNSYGAPIKIGVTGEYPLKVDLDESTDEVVYRIFFNNVGDGVPITDGRDGKIKGTIWLQGDAEFADCLGVSGGKRINIEDQVTLHRGESVKKACGIKLKKSDWSAIPEGTISLIFDMNYDYYIEAQATITAVGG